LGYFQPRKEGVPPARSRKKISGGLKAFGTVWGGKKNTLAKETTAETLGEDSLQVFGGGAPNKPQAERSRGKSCFYWKKLERKSEKQGRLYAQDE